MTNSVSAYFGWEVLFLAGERDKWVRGFKATMDRFYGQQPGRILYMLNFCAEAVDKYRGRMLHEREGCRLFLSGITDDSTALFCSAWRSKQDHLEATIAVETILMDSVKGIFDLASKDQVGITVSDDYYTACVVGRSSPNPLRFVTECEATSTDVRQ